jgi:hypothetical protein
MGQGPSTGSAQVTATRDPERIQREIDETRERLGDTVEALAAKTDVKAQAKQRIGRTKASVLEQKERLLAAAKDVSPEAATETASHAAQTAVVPACSALVRENPLPIATAGAFAAGFLAGRLRKRGRG